MLILYILRLLNTSRKYVFLRTYRQETEVVIQNPGSNLLCEMQLRKDRQFAIHKI